MRAADDTQVGHCLYMCAYVCVCVCVCVCMFDCNTAKCRTMYFRGIECICKHLLLNLVKLKLDRAGDLTAHTHTHTHTHTHLYAAE